MFNQFIGIGRLAAQPEIRHSQSGMQIASFTVCCDSGYGDKKKTEFMRCTAFDKLAGIVGEYLDKGSLVMIQGVIETRKWQDKDGNDRYSTGCIVREMKMLSPKSESSAPPEPPGGGYSTGEDIPFAYTF